MEYVFCLTVIPTFLRFNWNKKRVNRLTNYQTLEIRSRQITELQNFLKLSMITSFTEQQMNQNIYMLSEGKCFVTDLFCLSLIGKSHHSVLTSAYHLEQGK